VVVISHNIDVVFDVADRIVVLYVGRHVATFERSSTSPEQVVSAILGVPYHGSESKSA
jgi:D-xylose transport system ATP-binding protein